jgi:AraC-like DNA-binding protein
MPAGLIKERFRRPSATGPGVRIRPVFDDFHLLRMEADFEYPAHQHTNYELILVERGPYRCRLNKAELEVAEGQVLIVKPGDWHQDHLRRGQRHYVVHFRLAASTPGGEATALFAPGVVPAMQICRGDHRPDAALIGELRREAEQQRPYAGAVQDSLQEALFWRAVRDLPAEGLSEAIRRLPRDEAVRERIGVAMERRVRENPTVAQLARDLGMSERHLVGLCRRLLGESPARAFLRLKVRRAEELLRHRGLRVKEASDELGFANPYHFSRVFRRLTGRPPSRL